MQAGQEMPMIESQHQVMFVLAGAPISLRGKKQTCVLLLVLLMLELCTQPLL